MKPSISTSLYISCILEYKIVLGMKEKCHMILLYNKQLGLLQDMEIVYHIRIRIKEPD